MNFTLEMILSVVRQLLTFAGGFLVTKGTISADNEQQIIGGIIALISVIWGIVAKKQSGDPVAKMIRKT